MSSSPMFACCVLGEFDDVDFYRQITRGLGADGLPVRSRSRGHGRAPFAATSSARRRTGRGPRRRVAWSVTGVRGGVGATHHRGQPGLAFGRRCDRHTVLLDPDLHCGDARCC